MALVALTLDLIKNLLPKIEARGCSSRRIMSLGYPDIIATTDQVRQIMGDDLFSQLKYRDDAAAILRWHSGGAGGKDGDGKVVDAGHLFSLLGYELDVLDLVEARGGELLHDLNVPLPPDLHRRYALVIDAGTLEHCFNIAQAVHNVADLVAVGGAVMHGNPISMYNHGFYNLNPTWYHDFYEANGFAIELLKLVVDPVKAPRMADLPPYERFSGVPENAVQMVVVRRDAVQPVVWPVQKKYRDNPLLGK